MNFVQPLFRAIPLDTLNSTWLTESGRSIGFKQARPGQPVMAAVDEFGVQLVRLVSGAPFPTPVPAWTVVDGEATVSPPFDAQAVGGFNYVFDGADWPRQVAASNAHMSPAAQIPSGVALTVPPAHWGQAHAPAANTVATTSRAAGGANIRHVCTGIAASLSLAAASAASLLLVVRDGASGAGAILWLQRMAYNGLAIGHYRVELSGLNLAGSPNTAMTLEFSVAPGATNFETVSMSGYSVPA